MDAKVSCAPAGTGSACYIISGGPLAAGRLISEAGSGAAYFAAPDPVFCFLYFFSAGDGGFLLINYLFRTLKNTKLTHGSEKCISG